MKSENRTRNNSSVGIATHRLEFPPSASFPLCGSAKPASALCPRLPPVLRASVAARRTTCGCSKTFSTARFFTLSLLRSLFVFCARQGSNKFGSALACRVGSLFTFHFSLVPSCSTARRPPGCPRRVRHEWWFVYLWPSVRRGNGSSPRRRARSRASRESGGSG